MSKKKTSAAFVKFQPSWLDKNLYPEFAQWLAVDKDAFRAVCKICNCSFSLSNMGITAIRSHMDGKKHRLRMSGTIVSPDISVFFRQNDGCSKGLCKNTDDSVNELSSQPGTSSECLASKHPAVTINRFLESEAVLTAEILLVLNAVMCSESARSLGKFANLASKIFPDSVIAKKITLQKDKAGYLISYRLGPFVQSELLKTLQTSSFVVCFDESLNKVVQKEQMDFSLRFWDDSKSEVVTSYFTSMFLERTTASCLLQGFLEALNSLDLRRLLQVSMDGPNVNWAFLSALKTHIADTYGPETALLLEMGSCGLHTVHGSFKTGISLTGWNVVKFMRHCYYLFKNVPARRASYIRITGSDLFPKKFCAIRWLENTSVAERLLTMLPHLLKFVNEVDISSQSFSIVKETLGDKLLEVKLSFFHTLASDFEPFLEFFQSDKPLAPFLYASLEDLLSILMEKFVKSELLKTFKDQRKIARLDVDKEENLLRPINIELGYAVRQALKKVKQATEKEILIFKADVRSCLKSVVKKLQGKSPLKYKLTKGISCLSPSIALHSHLRKERLKVCLEYCVDNRQISGHEADRITRAYEELCSSPDSQTLLASFSRKDQRLDNLWLDLVKLHSSAAESGLLKFIRMLLVLSHGNAFTERGFSVNAHLLTENLQEQSLIAQRQVYDFVRRAGGVEHVTVTKTMLQFAKNASGRRREALMKQRNEREDQDKRKAEKRKAEEMIKELQRKKVEVLEAARLEVTAIDAEMLVLKKN